MFFNEKTKKSEGFVWGHKESRLEIVQDVFCRFCPYCVQCFCECFGGQFFKLSQKSVIGLGKEKGGKLFLSIMAAPRA